MSRVDVAVLDSAGIAILAATGVDVPGLLPLEGKLTNGGVYTLRVKDFGWTCTEEERVRPFRGGPPASAPKRVGTASVSYGVTKGGVRGGYVGGPMVEVYEDSRVATADIAIVADEALAPYLPLARFETFVDGTRWATSDRGEGVKRSQGDTDVTTAPDFTRIYAYCPLTSPASDAGATSSCFHRGTDLGPHAVEIRANVPGLTEELEPIRMAIDLRCPSPAALTPGAAPTTAGGGCTVSEGSSSQGPTALLVLAAIAHRRRTRRLSTSRPAERVSTARLLPLALLALCAACSEPAKTTTSSADASDERACSCTGVACQSGATLKFASPVPIADLASAWLEVCRLPADCVRVWLAKGTPPTPSLEVTVEGMQIHARWKGAIADGDVYRATLMNDDAGVVFQGEAPAGYSGVRVNECHYEGTRESCGSGTDCRQAVVTLVNALPADAGAD